MNLKRTATLQNHVGWGLALLCLLGSSPPLIVQELDSPGETGLVEAADEISFSYDRELSLGANTETLFDVIAPMPDVFTLQYLDDEKSALLWAMMGSDEPNTLAKLLVPYDEPDRPRLKIWHIRELRADVDALGGLLVANEFNLQSEATTCTYRELGETRVLAFAVVSDINPITVKEIRETSVRGLTEVELFLEGAAATTGLRNPDRLLRHGL